MFMFVYLDFQISTLNINFHFIIIFFIFYFTLNMISIKVYILNKYLWGLIKNIVEFLLNKMLIKFSYSSDTIIPLNFNTIKYEFKMVSRSCQLAQGDHQYNKVCEHCSNFAQFHLHDIWHVRALHENRFF